MSEPTAPKVIRAIMEESANLTWLVTLPTDLQEALEPRWLEGGRVHNWRNHVPAAIEIHWLELSEEARLVAYLMAKEQADSEEWD